MASSRVPYADGGCLPPVPSSFHPGFSEESVDSATGRCRPPRPRRDGHGPLNAIRGCHSAVTPQRGHRRGSGSRRRRAARDRELYGGSLGDRDGPDRDPLRERHWRVAAVQLFLHRPAVRLPLCEPLRSRLSAGRGADVYDSCDRQRRAQRNRERVSPATGRIRGGGSADDYDVLRRPRGRKRAPEDDPPCQRYLLEFDTFRFVDLPVPRPAPGVCVVQWHVYRVCAHLAGVVPHSTAGLGRVRLLRNGALVVERHGRRLLLGREHREHPQSLARAEPRRIRRGRRPGLRCLGGARSTRPPKTSRPRVDTAVARPPREPIVGSLRRSVRAGEAGREDLIRERLTGGERPRSGPERGRSVRNSGPRRSSSASTCRWSGTRRGERRADDLSTHRRPRPLRWSRMISTVSPSGCIEVSITSSGLSGSSNGSSSPVTLRSSPASARR